jgi:hypothetical protein
VMGGVCTCWYHNHSMAIQFTHIDAVSYRIDAVPRYATSYNARQLKAMHSNATSVPSSMMFFIYSISHPHDSYLLKSLTCSLHFSSHHCPTSCAHRNTVMKDSPAFVRSAEESACDLFTSKYQVRIHAASYDMPPLFDFDTLQLADC